MKSRKLADAGDGEAEVGAAEDGKLIAQASLPTAKATAAAPKMAGKLMVQAPPAIVNHLHQLRKWYLPFGVKEVLLRE